MSPIWRKIWKELRKGRRALQRFWQEKDCVPGTTLGGCYRVEGKLGMGSYGVAYLCTDQRTGKRCVLKRVFPLSGNKQRAEMLYIRETAILGRLRHPGIPRLLDRLRLQGLPCLVMEYVDGDTLDELLFRDNRTFTEPESLRLVSSLLFIVEYLHAERIIHRDISIGNVMLEAGRVRLIDFGLAVELEDKIPEAAAGAPDMDENDPMEKKLRRAVHVSSDFYAIGHLLLFLLYSTFDEKEKPRSAEEQGWESELRLHPLTRKLLRRLLQAEEPYGHIRELQEAVSQALVQLGEADKED